uniref:Uncharacterized protein n=1 Tax=Panagrolaimus sp. PS1159 TaxID=55785 RepID=A0AC35FJ00_9BILA
MFSKHNDPTKAFQHCKSVCKDPCKYWKYSKTLSTVNLSLEQAKPFITNYSETSQDLKNMIILEIFYTSLDYTVIKHMVAMTPSSFIAQLGGQFSLWIGGSMVSVVQFIIYICGGSFSHFYRKYIHRPKAQHRKCRNSFSLSSKTYPDINPKLSTKEETRI